MTAKQELFNILDVIGEELDITPTQFNKAKFSYDVSIKSDSNLKIKFLLE